MTAEAKEINRNLSAAAMLEQQADIVGTAGTAAPAFEPHSTAAELGLPNTYEFGLYVVEPPSGPRRTQLRLQMDRADDDDVEGDSDDRRPPRR